MYCVIFGAGEVGVHMAELLDRKGYQLAVVDSDPDAAQRLADRADVRFITGNVISHDIHRAAEIDKADLVLCVTSQDSENALAAMLAKKMGAKKVIARARSADFLAKRENTFRNDFGIDEFLCPETLAAEEIAKRIQTPGVGPIESFADGKVRLRELHVPADSKYINIPFKDVEFSSEVLIAAIFRRDKNIIPDGSSSFQAYDRFFVVGKIDEVEKMSQELGGELTPKRNVIIYGGSNIGVKLADILEDSGIMVKLIDHDKRRCHAVSEQLEKTLVLNGSGFDPGYLAQSGVGETDAFVAASNRGEHNIVSALIAKECGAAETIAVVDEAMFVPVIRRLGIDTAVSPRLITAGRVLRALLPEKIKALAILSEHEIDVLEIKTGVKSKIIGSPLCKTKLPQDTVIATIVRDENVIIPSGNDVIKAGDTVIVFTRSKNISAVERLF